MSFLVFAVYLGVGSVAAGFTVAIFPPRAGYKPPLHVCGLVLAICTLFWPMLVLMGLGYLTGWLCRRWSGEELSVRVVRAPRIRCGMPYHQAWSRN